MRTHLKCIPCFIKQSLETFCIATEDEKIQTKDFQEALKHLQKDECPLIARDICEEVGKLILRVKQ